MRDLLVAEFITLDGVIQAPGGKDEDPDGGFAHGGWTQPYWHDDIGTHFFEAMSQADAMLLGRKTWQTHGAAFDPLPAGDPFGDVLNGMDKYVVSTTARVQYCLPSESAIRAGRSLVNRKRSDCSGTAQYAYGVAITPVSASNRWSSAAG